MNDTKPISIEQQLENLPPLPITVANVLAVTNNPESSANDLVKAILPDQTMCVTVLKIANSALYGRPKKVDSLETAVAFLGFNEVQNIVLAKAAVQAFHPIFKNHEHDLSTFWDHSFTCGLAARIIGEHLGLTSGQFFAAGLLHDIGKLAMLLAFNKRYDTAQWLIGITTKEQLADEKALFSTTHDLVGSRLLQHWQFPDNLIIAMRHHHPSGSAGQLQEYPLVIQLADFLAHMHILSEKPNEHALKAALDSTLPGFFEQWRDLQLPWEDITLESLFAWVKIDRENGNGILDILAL